MTTKVSNKSSRDIKFGGFWVRFVGRIIDGFILFVPKFIVTLLFLTTPLNLLDMESIDEETAGIFFLYLFLINVIMQIVMEWLYRALLHSSSLQATLGQKAMGLKVVGKNKNKLSFGRATGRYFAETLCGFTLGIGFLMVGWTKNKQGLHDIVAETYVIKE